MDTIFSWGGPVGLGILLFCLGVFFAGLGVFLNIVTKIDKDKK